MLSANLWSTARGRSSVASAAAGRRRKVRGEWGTVLSFAPPLALVAALLASPARAQEREYARVVFGADTVVAEIASTPQQREQGLMFREALPEGTGMLFVFPEEEVRGFWMHNTLIDLDIAMFDADLVMVDLHHRRAHDREVHDSSAPFAWALEMPLGWFEERGIGVGDVAVVLFDDPPGAPRVGEDPPRGAGSQAADNTRINASISPS